MCDWVNRLPFLQEYKTIIWCPPGMTISSVTDGRPDEICLGLATVPPADAGDIPMFRANIGNGIMLLWNY